MKKQLQITLMLCLFTAPQTMLAQHAGAAGESKEVKADQQAAAAWAKNAIEGLSQIDQLILLNLVHAAGAEFYANMREGGLIHALKSKPFKPAPLLKISSNVKLQKLSDELAQFLANAYSDRKAKSQEILKAAEGLSDSDTQRNFREQNMQHIVRIEDRYLNFFQSLYDQTVAQAGIPKQQRLDLRKMAAFLP